MALNEIRKMYPTFEAWIQSHKHSSVSVEYALRDALDGGTDSPIEAMKSYISSLRELRSEIKGEISEAKYWIEYFRKEKR
jgi:hypothetical protein